MVATVTVGNRLRRRREKNERDDGFPGVSKKKNDASFAIFLNFLKKKKTGRSSIASDLLIDIAWPAKRNVNGPLRFFRTRIACPAREHFYAKTFLLSNSFRSRHAGKTSRVRKSLYV